MCHIVMRILKHKQWRGIAHSIPFLVSCDLFRLYFSLTSNLFCFLYFSFWPVLFLIIWLFFCQMSNYLYALFIIYTCTLYGLLESYKAEEMCHLRDAIL